MVPLFVKALLYGGCIKHACALQINNTLHRQSQDKLTCKLTDEHSVLCTYCLLACWCKGHMSGLLRAGVPHCWWDTFTAVDGGEGVAAAKILTLWET